MEKDNQLYQSYGLVYHKEASAFYYKGERVKIFIDERYMTKEEKEKYPWMEKAWQCSHIDPNTDSKLYLNTVRNRNNEIINITFLDPKEADDIINKEVKVVTFHGVYIGQKGFYASDKFEQGLPKEVVFLEENMAEKEGGLIKHFNKRETSGYIYYKDGHYPWEIEMKNGIMKVKLYTLESGDNSKSTIIQYVSEEMVKKIKLYVNGKEIPLKDFT